MKVKTSELIGPALDWAVAKCEGADPQFDRHAHGRIWQWWTIADPEYRRMPQYSTHWSQGGQIIEREKIAIAYEPSMVYDDSCRWKALAAMSDNEHQYGPTPLIAAMRCYVASKMGDEVEIPEQLKV